MSQVISIIVYKNLTVNPLLAPPPHAPPPSPHSITAGQSGQNSVVVVVLLLLARGTSTLYRRTPLTGSQIRNVR